MILMLPSTVLPWQRFVEITVEVLKDKETTFILDSQVHDNYCYKLAHIPRHYSDPWPRSIP